MTHQQLEELLRSHPDPRERAYRRRSIPSSIEEAWITLSRHRPAILHLAVAGLAGAVAALVLVAMAGSAVRLFDPRTGLGGRSESSTSVTPATDSSRPCRSADFSVRAEPWPDAPLAGGVSVIFTAGPSTQCMVERGVYAVVEDANGVSFASATAPREPLQVRARSTWRAGVAWSTYCSDAAGGAAVPEHLARPVRLYVALALPGEGDTIGDALIPVDTAAEIAPEPCAGDYYPRTPFILLVTMPVPEP